MSEKERKIVVWYATRNKNGETGHRCKECDTWKGVNAFLALENFHYRNQNNLYFELINIREMSGATLEAHRGREKGQTCKNCKHQKPIEDTHYVDLSGSNIDLHCFPCAGTMGLSEYNWEPEEAIE